MQSQGKTDKNANFSGLNIIIFCNYSKYSMKSSLIQGIDTTLRELEIEVKK